MGEPTYCEHCEHCSRTNDNEPTWRWLCRQHPRISGGGFVTKDRWDKDAPFLRCVDVNGGACKLYERKTDG